MHKKAEMGMGTLIIFIAMVLVAAVAAGVLLQTTGTLQNKALQTGKATTAEVGSSVQTLELYAEDGSNQNVEYFYQTLKLTSGSEPLRFEDALLTFNTDNTSADLSYSSDIDCSVEAHLNSTTAYGISYSIQGNNYKSGYLNRGDVVKLCYASPRSIIEDEEIKLSFVPKVGTPHVIDPLVPDLMVDKRVFVYP